MWTPAGPAGWGIALDDAAPRAYFAARFAELVAAVDADGAPAVIGVDMPIGLPDAGVREADLAARHRLTGRASSVFLMPVRAALQAADHATASTVQRQFTGSGVSIQAYSLRRRIFELEAWLGEHASRLREDGRRVVEVHPELSFAELAGNQRLARKDTWTGADRRRALLAGAGIHLPDDLGRAGEHARVDDVLDAAAAAWSARRVARREAVSLPNPPQRLSDDVDCAIWV